MGPQLLIARELTWETFDLTSRLVRFIPYSRAIVSHINVTKRWAIYMLLFPSSVRGATSTPLLLRWWCMGILVMLLFACDAVAVVGAASTHKKIFAYVSNLTSGNYNWNYNLGLDFNVLVPIVVYDMGTFNEDRILGLNAVIEVGLFNRNTQLLVPGTKLTLRRNNTVRDGRVSYAPLSVPITLVPGQYAVAARGYYSGVLQYLTTNNAPRPPTASNMYPGGCDSRTTPAINFVGGGRYDDQTTLKYPDDTSVSPPGRYCAGTFSFIPVGCLTSESRSVSRDDASQSDSTSVSASDARTPTRTACGTVSPTLSGDSSATPTAPLSHSLSNLYPTPSHSDTRSKVHASPTATSSLGIVHWGIVASDGPTGQWLVVVSATDDVAATRTVGVVLSKGGTFAPAAVGRTDCFVFAVFHADGASTNNASVNTTSNATIAATTAFLTRGAVWSNVSNATNGLVRIGPMPPRTDTVQYIVLEVHLNTSCLAQSAVVVANTILVSVQIDPAVLSAEVPPSVIVARSVSAVASVVADPLVAVQANRLALSLLLLVCDIGDGPLPFYSSPLPLAVGDSDVAYIAGSAVGNAAVLFAFAGLQGVVAALWHWRHRHLPWQRALAFARLPSLTVFPMMVLQQPSIAAIVATSLRGDATQRAVVGAAAIGSVIPFAVVCGYLCTARFQCAYDASHPSNIKKSRVAIFFFGRGKWLDGKGSGGFKQQCQFLFADYTNRCHTFLLAEMCMNVACGVVQGLIYPGQCKTLLFANGAVVLSFLCVVVWLRPFSSHFQMCYSIGSCLLQLINVGLSLAAVQFGEAGAFAMASDCSLVTTYLVLVQVVVGLWPKGRRFKKLLQTLRRECGGGCDVNEAPLLTEHLLRATARDNVDSDGDEMVSLGSVETQAAPASCENGVEGGDKAAVLLPPAAADDTATTAAPCETKAVASAVHSDIDGAPSAVGGSDAAAVWREMDIGALASAVLKRRSKWGPSMVGDASVERDVVAALEAVVQMWSSDAQYMTFTVESQCLAQLDDPAAVVLVDRLVAFDHASASAAARLAAANGDDDEDNGLSSLLLGFHLRAPSKGHHEAGLATEDEQYDL